MSHFLRISSSTLEEKQKDKFDKFVNPSPDPYKYKIVSFKQDGKYSLLKINYPNCTNYEGNKILLFKGYSPEKFMNIDRIDPHFIEGKDVIEDVVPIARFEPTDYGWSMGIALIAALIELDSKVGIRSK